MLIANIPGLLMAFLSLGAAAGLGFEERHTMMMLAGTLMVLMDVAFRAWPWRHDSEGCGGSVCHIPAWVLGLFWLGFGFYYALSPA